jgi:hypothetical protein
MNRLQWSFAAVAVFAILVASQLCSNWIVKTNNTGRFDLSSERIVKDLDGKVVNVMLNQVWPFDSSQNINLQVVGKKQMDEYVVVVVDVKVIAAVQQQELPKEQTSVNPANKEVPKTTPKWPSKLQLSGKMKLTYELLNNEWYLLSADNLNLKAVPVD